MVPKLYIIPGAEDRSLTYAAYAAYSNDLPSLQRMVADNPDLINASDNMISPLEAGIRGGSVECVSFILEHPNFDQELSFGLLHALSCIELSEKVETCILTASTALLGEPFCRNTPAPLPSPFTSKFITYSGNFFLLIRFLLYNNVTAKDLRQIGTYMDWFHLLHKDESLSVPLLARCLSAHPTLLKYKKVYLTFLVFCLRSSLGSFLNIISSHPHAGNSSKISRGPQHDRISAHCRLKGLREQERPILHSSLSVPRHTGYIANLPSVFRPGCHQSDEAF